MPCKAPNVASILLIVLLELSSVSCHPLAFSSSQRESCGQCGGNEFKTRGLQYSTSTSSTSGLLLQLQMLFPYMLTVLLAVCSPSCSTPYSTEEWGKQVGQLALVGPLLVWAFFSMLWAHDQVLEMFANQDLYDKWFACLPWWSVLFYGPICSYIFMGSKWFLQASLGMAKFPKNEFRYLWEKVKYSICCFK